MNKKTLGGDVRGNIFHIIIAMTVYRSVGLYMLHGATRKTPSIMIHSALILKLSNNDNTMYFTTL